jgi:hypothetical protein
VRERNDNKWIPQRGILSSLGEVRKAPEVMKSLGDKLEARL